MPQQSTLFDALEAQRRRDAALEAVEAGAPIGWSFHALRVVERIARARERFTPDDIWEAGLDKPPEPRALGPVMIRAVKDGICERLDEWMPSQIPTQHKTPIRVYRSLLFGGN